MAKEIYIVDILFYDDADKISVVYKNDTNAPETEWEAKEIDKQQFHNWLQKKYDLSDYEHVEEVDMHPEIWMVSQINWDAVTADYYTTETVVEYLNTIEKKKAA